jgi:hypothetical protein
MGDCEFLYNFKLLLLRLMRMALGAGLETRRTEARVTCAALNRMTPLGMPEPVCVG